MPLRNYLLTWSIWTILLFYSSVQDCPKEVLDKGISVTWFKTSKENDVPSEPPCYVDGTLITRNCNGTHWTPPLQDLASCSNVTKYLNYLRICPPGFSATSRKDGSYCYKIDERSEWNNTCYDSGGATVITDLSSSNIISLINILSKINISQYFWLPAKRSGVFLAPAWTIPGPSYGKTIKAKDVINSNLTLWKNCVALDIKNQILTTECCSQSFPGLCLYINDLYKPTRCPEGYYSFRFMPNVGTCYGIEWAGNTKGHTIDHFQKNKCTRPMGDYNQYDSDLVRFLFYKIAKLHSLPKEDWCWFAHTNKTPGFHENSTYPNAVIINRYGTISLTNSNVSLPCIACEADVVYNETELNLQYNEVDKKIYLTVYHPSSLLKYQDEDKGVRCFSNAKGPALTVNISDNVIVPYDNVETVIYSIELSSSTPAEYWCVGHTKQFTSIKTNKIVINPQKSNMHVFSLAMEIDITSYFKTALTITADILSNLRSIFEVENIVIMEIVKKTENEIMAMTHLQAFVNKISEHETLNILGTYDRLKEIAMTTLSTFNYTFVNISSATHCLPVWSEDIFTLHWDLTPIGHVATPTEFCLQLNGLPVTRYCNGSYTFGAFWSEIVGNCNPNVDPSMATKYLFNFVNCKLSEIDASRFLTKGLDFVLKDIDIIIPADIYYLAKALNQINQAAQNNDTKFEMSSIQHMTWVMDRIMSLNTNSLRLAQTLNSTNVLLDTVDNLIEFMSRQVSSKSRTFSKNYQIAVQPKFMVQISHPYLSNITGVAISRISESNNFTNMHIQPLFRNTSIDEVFSIDKLELATWLPENLLLSLQKNGSENNKCNDETHDLSLIITVFYDDSVFQELEETESVINSRIVGVSIPGYFTSLTSPLPLLFKEINDSNLKKHCVFWNFHQHQSNLPGLWSENGCYLVKTENGINVCECYHLTHFGNLIHNNMDAIKNENPSHEIHMTALNIISLVGCFLSLFGIIGIWITALVFQTWRKKAGTKILLHLTVSIALPLIIFVVFNLDNTIFLIQDSNYSVDGEMKTVCILLGVMIHYSILASFLWMLITAFLQFIRYVRVLGIKRPKRFTIKLSLIAWGLPAIPVIVVLCVDRNNYIPELASVTEKGPICYPQGIFSLTCVTLPVCVILVINILIFIRIIYAISRGPDGKKRKADLDLVYAQMRLSILLFFLLGLTWIFGLFSFSNNYIWSYLFCLTSTMQGLILFIYFVICDPNTRKLWVMLIKPQFVNSASRESITSSSNHEIK